MDGPRDGQANGRGRRGPTIEVGKLFDRLPPHSVQAEMSLLGSMILDPQRAIPEVLGVVTRPEDFYLQKHTLIFQAVVDVYERHQSGDLVQIAGLLRDRGVYEDVGGDEYLVELAESVPSAVNAPHYARMVADKSRLRRLIDSAGEIIYDAYHVGDFGPEGAREVLDKAESAVFEIAQQAEKSDPQRLAELLQIEWDRIEASEGRGITGLPTGFGDLDERLSGLQPGEMLILAARPSMGKTALALNLAEQVSFGGRTPWQEHEGAQPTPVGVFSLEMNKSSVVQRLISAYSGVDSHKIRTGMLHGEDSQRIMDACSELERAPIYVDDMPGLTVLQLRARARRMVAQHGVRAIFIDYLQLLTAPAQARESRQVEVSAISRQIKALARELNVPIVCLAQLNRGAEQRERNRPRMSDLRESGSIEQDADVVLLLHREAYYHKDDEEWLNDPLNSDRVNLSEVIVAKQRNGPTGVVKLTWDDRITRFKAYTRGDEYAGAAMASAPDHFRAEPKPSPSYDESDVGDVPF
jgi:replicative DNA helicase